MHPLAWVLIIIFYLCFNGIITLAWVGTEKTNLITVLVLFVAGLPIFMISFIILIVTSGILMVSGDWKRDKGGRKK